MTKRDVSLPFGRPIPRMTHDLTSRPAPGDARPAAFSKMVDSAGPGDAARERALLPPPAAAQPCLLLLSGRADIADGVQPALHRACGQRCAQHRRGLRPALGITGDHLCITKGDVPADVRKPLRVTIRPFVEIHTVRRKLSR